MNQRFQSVGLALALLSGLTACEDSLTETPRSFLTTNTFYATGADLNTATLAVYQSLRNYAGNGLGALAESLASDEGRHDPGETNTGTVNADFLVWDATQTNQTTSAWSPSYQLIYRANLVIANAPDVTMNEATRAAYVAEAKFLRAYAYFELLKRFSSGNKDSDLGVPLLLAMEDYNNPELKRATQGEVFTQIINDITEVEPVLPLTRTGGEAGRVTRGAADMALAEVYLWRSSFMLSNEWQKASDWAKKVIDSNQYSLNNSYFGVFSPSNRNNRENIFRVVASERAGVSYVNSFYPRQLGFTGSPGGGFGLVKGTRWLLSTYAPGDVRGVVGPQSDTVAYRNTACFADPARGCPLLVQGREPGFENVPHVWKFRPSTATNGLGDVDVQLYRYAETLLFYAEAQNELGNTATAIEALNQIRARARRGSTGSENRAQPADLPTNMTKEQARDAIYMERLWELSFEHGERWYDLVRRDSMEPGYWVSQLQAHDPSPGARGPLTPHLKRFPIPTSEITLLGSLEQNPGY